MLQKLIYLGHDLTPARNVMATLYRMENRCPPGSKFSQEVEAMLAERAREWARPWYEEGRRQGLQEGESRLLLRQLERKFGPLEAEVCERIVRADAERLLVWGERVLTADRLEDVWD